MSDAQKRENIFLSVIIPAYNEAGKIQDTILDISRYLERKNFLYEIIVVNDGSSDSTADLVRHLSQQLPALRLIDNLDNFGKGKAVKQGMLAAAGSVCLFTDADNSTRMEQFEKLLPFLENGFEVVIGSRALKDARIKVKQPRYRILLGKLGNKVIRILAAPGIKDTQCGFKAFSRAAAGKIFPSLKINGWGFDIEVLALARHFGFKIKEIGIEWLNDPRSHFKARDYFFVLQEILFIRWNLLFRKY